VTEQPIVKAELAFGHRIPGKPVQACIVVAFAASSFAMIGQQRQWVADTSTASPVTALIQPCSVRRHGNSNGCAWLSITASSSS